MFLCKLCFCAPSREKTPGTWAQNFQKNCENYRKLYEFSKKLPTLVSQQYSEPKQIEYLRELDALFRDFSSFSSFSKTSQKSIEEEQKTASDLQNPAFEELEFVAESSEISGSCAFFMVNESKASRILQEKSAIFQEKSAISQEKSATPSEISEGLGSFPQKFAYYEQNTFFSENCLIDKKIERKTTNFVSEEIKSQENQAIFKKTLRLFEKHLNDACFPLHVLKESYLVILRKQRRDIFLNFDENAPVSAEKSKDFSRIIKEIDCFLSLFRTCLLDFYQISENSYINENFKLKSLFSQESFRYFTINYFFFEEEFYNLVFSLEIKRNFKEEASFLQIVKKLVSLDLNLADFGVAKEFILCENPLLDSEDQRKSCENHTINNYSLAIDCIKNLQYIKSPVHKLKSVVLCGIMIKKAIEDFYFKKNKRINSNLIEGREFIRIYFFVVYKSKAIHLPAHCSLIRDFIHKNVLDSLKLPFFKYFLLSAEFFQNSKKFLGNKYQFSQGLEDFLVDNDYA